MGLLEALLGKENPATQWAGKNQNWLGTVGTGIANGLEFGNLGQAKQMDYLGEQEKIALGKVEAQSTASQRWLRQTYPDLADQADAGAPIADLMKVAFERMKPQEGGSEFDSRYAAGQQYGLTGDALNNFALTGNTPAAPEEDFRPLSPEERTQWGIPTEDTTPYAIGPDGLPKPIGGSGGQTINIGGTTDEFYGSLDKAAGADIMATMSAGANARSSQIRLGELEQLLQTAPQGGVGRATQMLGSLGIPTEGLDEVQAAQALINQMVPLQRAPGSGPMSDKDLELFKASLPAIINQPGGNQKIIAAIKGINEYTIAQAQIAEAVANRQITPAEGRRLAAQVPNPLQGITAAPASAPSSSNSGNGWTLIGVE